GPLRTLEPMGRCVKGAIDLNNPVPFAQPRFGGTVVGIASSGGGSRATYLSAAVLREIRRGGAAPMLSASSDAKQSLPDQVDGMSSVSGSSLAAGYFVLNSEELKVASADSTVVTETPDKIA